MKPSSIKNYFITVLWGSLTCILLGGLTKGLHMNTGIDIFHAEHSNPFILGFSVMFWLVWRGTTQFYHSSQDQHNNLQKRPTPYRPFITLIAVGAGVLLFVLLDPNSGIRFGSSFLGAGLGGILAMALKKLHEPNNPTENNFYDHQSHC